MTTLDIDQTLKITEIFYSLQGESSTIGLPTVFVRLTGCPLRCVYCDTEYAFYGGKRQPVADVVRAVEGYQAHYVTVTGGEPLAQPACLLLLRELCDRGLKVSIETSGALDIGSIDSRVKVIMDIKTPDSKEADKNDWHNIDKLKSFDEVKFVIASREDYDWSKAICDKYDLKNRCEVLFSPVHGVLAAKQLADWVVADRILARVQIQLHKLLWQDQMGR